MPHETSRREFLLGGAFALALLGSAARAEGTPMKTNVAVILVDDWPDSMWSRKTVPKIFSRLVDGGTLFRNGFACTPWCEPTRAAMYRGLYPHETGVLRGGTTELDREWYGRDQEADTVATRVKAHDPSVRTGFFGKYFNVFRFESPPPGWDSFVHVQRYGSRSESYGYWVNGEKKTMEVSNRDDTTLTFDFAERFVRRNADAPWFVWVAPNAPHGPATATPAHAHDFDGEQLPKGPAYDATGLNESEMRSAFEAMKEECRDVDDGVARFFAALEASGQLENTLVVFVSDNGYNFGEHGAYKKTWPWDESVGVPFVASGPGMAQGVRTGALVSQIDVPYTVLSVFGADTSGLSGRDLRLHAEPGQSWREHLLVEHPYAGWYQVRESGWAYFEHDGGASHLYDMVGDDAQVTNLSGSSDPAVAEVEARLSARLAALKAAKGEEFGPLEVGSAEGGGG